MTYLGAWWAASGSDVLTQTELDAEVLGVLEDQPERAFTVTGVVRVLHERGVTLDGPGPMGPAVLDMLSELELDGQVRSRALSWRRPRISRVWHYVPSPERVARAAGLRARMRALAGVAAGAVVLSLSLLLSDGGGPDAVPTAGAAGVVTSSTTVALPTTAARVEPVDAAPRKCQEDELCFNSCLWGTNGLLYPEWDSRAGLPGPCDTTSATSLPRGRRLDVLVVPMPWSGVACEPASPGWRYAEVSVLLRESDGREVPQSRMTVHGCVPAEPGELGRGLNGALPVMLHVVGSRA